MKQSSVRLPRYGPVPFFSPSFSRVLTIAQRRCHTLRCTRLHTRHIFCIHGNHASLVRFPDTVPTSRREPSSHAHTHTRRSRCRLYISFFPPRASGDEAMSGESPSSSAAMQQEYYPSFFFFLGKQSPNPIFCFSDGVDG